MNRVTIEKCAETVVYAIQVIFGLENFSYSETNKSSEKMHVQTRSCLVLDLLLLLLDKNLFRNHIFQ